MLVLALMLALSFNLSRALHEKIRLQQHSDALAYSMAIVEARAMNYFATSNRAIAASYVAMNMLHAHLAATSATAHMMKAGEENFIVIGAQEFFLCAVTRSLLHCRDGTEAFQKARQYNREASRLTQQVRSMDGPFQRAIVLLDRMVDELHASQQRVLTETAAAVRTGSAQGLSALKQVNAPAASDLPASIGALNEEQLRCAIDGLPCRKAAGTTVATRARVMTEVSNATRPPWTAGRRDTSHFRLDFLKTLTRDIPGEGFTWTIGHRGTAKTTNGLAGLHTGRSPNDTGAAIAADEHGYLFTFWRHGAWTSRYEAHVVSNANGGAHSPGHSGSHDFEGVNVQELLRCARIPRGNCFMQFRANPEPSADFGQAHVYSYVTQPLRAGVKKGPWELNERGTVRFQDGASGTGTLRLAPGDGAGLSQALVYYHRLGSWKEMPNLFGPYWRAKLHPLPAQQAADVLTAAGNEDAAAVARGQPLPR